ncbi:MAG TPA: electron transport complex subunit RsxG [Marinagarivorans sp.]|nr:electron transport complex subunit RsxG [Marinagarivorans sp.]HNG61662.1 electron transport complex subunit RsxG [Cellvibrionaceae bacterium]
MHSPLIRALRTNSLSLTAFASCCALLLGGIYQWTQAPIAQQQLRIQQAALDEIIPAAEHDNAWDKDFFTLNDEDWQALGAPNNRKVFVARQGDAIMGYILPIKTSQGYSGDIELLLGVYVDGRIAATRVVAHKETPGLGDKIDIKRHTWITGFNLKSLNEPKEELWRVKKDNGVFDQFAGATITPRACVAAIKQGLRVFDTRKQQWQQAFTAKRVENP